MPSPHAYSGSLNWTSAELGRLPLNITIIQKILNYILYIKSKDEESFVKLSFLRSSVLYHCGNKNFRRFNE